MAFVSYTYSGDYPATKQSIYTIVDSELGEIEAAIAIMPGTNAAGDGDVIEVAIVEVYASRNLDVGRNLALFVIYDCKRLRSNITDLIRWQDKYCPKYIENWDMYAKDRDRHLEKLLALL